MARCRRTQTFVKNRVSPCSVCAFGFALEGMTEEQKEKHLEEVAARRSEEAKKRWVRRSASIAENARLAALYRKEMQQQNVGKPA